MMTGPDPAPAPQTPPSMPRAEVVRARRGAGVLIWLVPLVALVVAGILFYQSAQERGRTIRIRFINGGGIQANDPVMYRGMHVGRVRSVSLSRDMSSVLVVADIRSDASALAVEGSRFWIVHPVVSLNRVSGLETLLGPKYVEVEPGPDAAATRSEFTGLEREPVMLRPSRRPTEPGAPSTAGELALTIQAKQRHSLNIGSPVLYRGVKVGSVTLIDLADSGQSVDVTVVIEGQYSKMVRSNSVFFSASGFGVDINLSGVALRAGSLESVVTGGIEFATPTKAGVRASNGDTFPLEEQAPKGYVDWSPDLGDDAPAAPTSPADPKTPPTK